MPKVYRIHPGIGIARVGKSKDGFFLEGDQLSAAPYELDKSGPVAFKGYKDAAFQVRKQGARFRVFEYEQDPVTGNEKLIGEITAEKAVITWHIVLGNGKASGPLMELGNGSQGERIIVPDPTAKRNNNVTNRADLYPVSKPTVLKGINQLFQQMDGKIMNNNVVLGSAGTDFSGNLVVLGGSGEAGSWNNPASELPDYLNNDGWYDNTADGPVDATLKFADGTEVEVQHGSWVIVGPPDFAPGILPIVSLWDLMYDAFVHAGRLSRVTDVSYDRHIFPILQRAANYRWIHDSTLWDKIFQLMTSVDLGDNSASMKANREKAYTFLTSNSLTDFKLTKTQQLYFTDWKNGNFVRSAPVSPVENELPYLIDFASLSRTIGSGLFPGIEMGFMATNAQVYAEQSRLTRQSFTDPQMGAGQKLQAGSVIQRMACPWQADFMECARNWWPAQRPDQTKFRPDGTPANIYWTRGLVVGTTGSQASHMNMVNFYSDLGVIEETNINGKMLYVEKGRNPALPQT